MQIFNNKTVLITGGTGSFGNCLVKRILQEAKPKAVRILSRDELKQSEMQKTMSEYSDMLRFFVGDVRDKSRLIRAFQGVDFVVHAAALKQIPSCEYNPFEAIQTNIIGAMNVIEAALDAGVEQVIALSTDKAASPITLYGATKLCAEKLFVQANSYAGSKRTRFSCVRYGNVIASRGSVIPVFLEAKKKGVLPVTDERMTRFWMTLDQAVDLVTSSFMLMHGGEVFIPKIPSMRIIDLVKTIAPECTVKIIGIRPSEKLHEMLIGPDESRRTLDIGDRYVLIPEFSWWSGENYITRKPVSDGFVFSSDQNTNWLSSEDLQRLIAPFVEALK